MVDGLEGAVEWVSEGARESTRESSASSGSSAFAEEAAPLPGAPCWAARRAWARLRAALGEKETVHFFALQQGHGLAPLPGRWASAAAPWFWTCGPRGGRAGCAAQGGLGEVREGAGAGAARTLR